MPPIIAPINFISFCFGSNNNDVLLLGIRLADSPCLILTLASLFSKMSFQYSCLVYDTSERKQPDHTAKEKEHKLMSSLDKM